MTTSFEDETPFAHYFEDLWVGYRWRSRGRTITETDIVLFAMLSGDWFPVHTDRHFAAETPAGRRSAHGFLTLSLAAGLMQPSSYEASIGLYGLDRTRWVRPLLIDETMSVEIEVVDLEKRDDTGGVVTCEVEVKNDAGDVVLVCGIRAKQRLRSAAG